MGFWRFSQTGEEFGSPLAGSYDLSLVVLSLAIACFASLAALAIVSRIRAAADRRLRASWLAAGATAMGCGIWAMHFTGMLAFTLPAAVRYDLTITLLSLAPAILASGAALYFITQPRPDWKRLQTGALLMAVGIGTMHYTGMEGMNFPGVMRYDPVLFVLSLVVAYLLAMVAIYVRFVLIDRWVAPALWVQPAVAIIMGNAVAGMHYTAMAAARFHPGPGPEDIEGEFTNLAFGSTITAFAVMILLVTMVATMVHRRISDSEMGRRRQESRANTILNTTADGILAIDDNGRILSCNRAAQAIFRVECDDIIRQPITNLVPGLIISENAVEESENSADSRSRSSLHKGFGRRSDGTTLPLEIAMNSVPESDARMMVLSLRDMSERHQAEAKIEYLAFYDSLTGLPNRALLRDRLQQALLARNRNRKSGALIFIDLDGFKKLNDTFGHDIGDRFLKLVGRRLTDCIRRVDTVARVGGDEFVIILENLSGQAKEAAGQARLVGEKILRVFRRPFLLVGHEHHSSPSMGITLFHPEQPVTVEELLKQADLAMYQAKHDGGATLRFFDPEMQARINERTSLELELRQALSNDELILHYQPQVDPEGRVFAAEALVRWLHPRRGLVSPAEFIPLAEQTGLIHPLGQWILETVCRQLVAWQERPETRHLNLSVNVSVQQLRRKDFVDQVLALVERTGADPHRLKLELTENILVDNMENTIDKMNRLQSKGVGFSLDDFGTGYSSLYYLKRLPLSQLKIDQSFVRDVPDDANDAAIARMIIALASLLELDTVAEGVETEEQRAFLAENGCHAYQGFLFSTAVPVDEFEALLQKD